MMKCRCIPEGTQHQAKRMLHAIKNSAGALHRISIGKILLDENLAPREYRALTEEEIACV